MMTVLLLFLFLFTATFQPVAVSAASYPSYTNSETGYEAVIIDNANYLSSSEETALLQEMVSITQFTNVCYLTDENNISYSESYSKNLCKKTLASLFGSNAPAVIYEVDNEYDYIYAQGNTYDVITSQKAYSITDNVYTYSASERFYDGAVEAFSEIYSLLRGSHISEPMKYICNTFLALFIALLINFIYVISCSKFKRASISEMASGAQKRVLVSNLNVVSTGQSRRYSPQSSGSSHGGGGHHGGGGGHHGGGGGHSH